MKSINKGAWIDTIPNASKSIQNGSREGSGSYLETNLCQTSCGGLTFVRCLMIWRAFWGLVLKPFGNDFHHFGISFLIAFLKSLRARLSMDLSSILAPILKLCLIICVNLRILSKCEPLSSTSSIFEGPRALFFVIFRRLFRYGYEISFFIDFDRFRVPSGRHLGTISKIFGIVLAMKI